MVTDAAEAAFETWQRISREQGIRRMIPPNTSVRADWDDQVRAVCVDMLRHIATIPGEERLVVRHPDGWWQMLKHEHAPRWFRKWFPVKYREQVYQACAWLPDLVLPHSPEGQRFLKHTGRPVYRWESTGESRGSDGG